MRAQGDDRSRPQTDIRDVDALLQTPYFDVFECVERLGCQFNRRIGTSEV